MDQQTEAELRRQIATLQEQLAMARRLRLVTAQMALDEMDHRVAAALDTIRQSKKRLGALRNHVTKQQVAELDLIISELPSEI